MLNWSKIIITNKGPYRVKWRVKNKLAKELGKYKMHFSINGSNTINKCLIPLKLRVHTGRTRRFFKTRYSKIGFKIGALKLTRKPFHFPLHRKKKR